MNLLDYARQLGLDPQKVSTANGGEYASGCPDPACGDGGKGRRSDRFHIWPAMETKGLGVGRYWCRQCGITGDTIAFLQTYLNMDFREACQEHGVALPNNGAAKKHRHIASPVLPESPQGWKPRVYPMPDAKWQEKANNLLLDCRAVLAVENEAMAWLEARGISREFADRFGVGFNQSSKGGDRYRPRSAWGLPAKEGRGGKQVNSLWIPRGWVIPSFNQEGRLQQLRVRRMDADVEKFCDNIKYLPIDGSSSATLIYYPEAEVFVPVECGFDAMLIAGSLHGKVGAITTWNDSARPDVTAHRLLQRSSLILGGLDFDEAGEKQQEWWNTVYKQHRRLPQPGPGIKDPGDAYAAGINIREWIVDALPRGLRIKLGFAAGARPVQKQQQQDRVDAVPAPVTPAATVAGGGPRVIEVELTDGLVISITDDQQLWQELTDAGKPVFSRNEMERLKLATSTMSPQERLDAAMLAIATKQVFKGYIPRGRVLGDDVAAEDTGGDAGADMVKERACKWTLNKKA
jgi:hypothetical protein